MDKKVKCWKISEETSDFSIFGLKDHVQNNKLQFLRHLTADPHTNIEQSQFSFRI